jgi:hypothetical protein
VPGRCDDDSFECGVRDPLAREVRIAMKNSLFIAIGVLIAIAGVVFALQGLGYIGGSVMSGVTFWAVAGPVIALAGLVMAAAGLRRRSAR